MLIWYLVFLFIRIDSSVIDPTGIQYRGQDEYRFKSFRVFRGGSATSDELSKSDSFNSVQSVTCVVSTSLGSSFLDKKKKIVVPFNSTILDLKSQIFAKFPGNPPINLQNIYYGVRKLNDTEIIGNLSKLYPVPLLLDMISGTSTYNKFMSVSQALEAFASLTVHQVYLNAKIHDLYSSKFELKNEGENSVTQSKSVMETALYRDIFKSINDSLHKIYEEDIEEALVVEKDPEVVSFETMPWRNKNIKRESYYSPLALAIAKEFDLNTRGVVTLAYYSVLLGVN